MKVYAIGKKSFEDIMKSTNLDDTNIENKKDTCLISITDPDEGERVFEHYFKENHKNVLNLKFGDVDRDIKTKHGICNAMSKEQAKECYDFIKENRDVQYWIIHCTMGISRSGAIAQFINDFFGVDEHFNRNNPYISPNPHVSSLLKIEMYNDLTEK
jgi:predicted protein tyrosine phosphatase